MTRQIDTHTEGIPETSSSKGSANLDCVCGIARLCVNQSNMRFWRGERSQELRVRETRSVIDACNDVRLLSAIVREYARTATTNRSPCPMLRITKMEVRARNRCGRVSAVCAARADFVGDRINPSPTGGLSSPYAQRLPCGASRAAALLIAHLCPISSLFAPCGPGAARRHPLHIGRGQATSGTLDRHRQPQRAHGPGQLSRLAPASSDVG